MLRGAIVGFGEVAEKGHWPAYAGSPDFRIVAVVDRTAARRSRAIALAPDVAAFETLDELAASMPLDFIDICTPPALHGTPMLAAIDRGWHVICEKPFLLDATLFPRVRADAIRAGVAVVPVHNWKYAPIIQAATAALQAGAIGSLRRVDVSTTRVKAAPTADADGSNWRRDPAVAGGGILMDHGWHAVYLALHWFAEPPQSVRASLHIPPAGGVEDEAAVTIEFGVGQANLNLTWNGAVRRNTCRLVGTDGEISVNDDTLGICTASTALQTFPSALSAGSHHADWFAAMLPDVRACFLSPDRSHPLLDEAASCLSIIQQAYRNSVSTGSLA